MGLLHFAGGSFVVLSLAALGSVYVLGQVEPAWGRGGSAQVMLWLAIAGAFVACLAFGFAAAITRRFPSAPACWALGAVSAAVFLFALWLVSAMSSQAAAVWWVLPVLPLAAFAAPVVLWRRG